MFIEFKLNIEKFKIFLFHFFSFLRIFLCLWRKNEMYKSFGDFFLSCKECVLKNPRSFYGSFSLGPFKNSQSLTVANALRRTLLTEIFGIAITNIEIDGIFHEYSTIDGVRESILDILLNFKQIVLKTSSPLTKPVYGYLNVRGPGIVRVSDLKLPPNIQYVDPDQYIATLNENGKLCLKVTISDFQLSCISPLKMKFDEIDGKTLKNNENQEKTFLHKSFTKISENKQEGIWKKKKTKSLEVEANFNPILKVNYLIESLQPIQNSLENEVIHIELWTNGSLHPRKALNFAIDFLKTMFEKLEIMEKVNSKMSSSFFESDETFVKILKTLEYDLRFYDTIESKNSSVLFSIEHNELSSKNSIPQFTQKLTEPPFLLEKEPTLNSSIEILNLPSRVSQSLIQHNVFKIKDLVKFHQKELKKFSGLGNFSVFLIQKKLKKFGFELKS